MPTHTITALRNAQMDAYTTEMGSAGLLDIYDGAQPSAGGAATTLLAQFTCGSPFAPAASGGVLSPTLPANTTGLAAGTATWYRMMTSGGAWVRDGVIADLGLNTTTISVGLPMSVTSWTITAANA